MPPATLALGALALTVTLSLSRPRIGRFRLQPSVAALLGAAVVVGFGLVPVGSALTTLRLLLAPLGTIAALMAMTLAAERTGLIAALAEHLARAAGGDARRLFAYLFFTGTATGTVFTNDAAILLYTPLVFGLVERIQEPGWTLRNKLPFYFAVLYVGNLVGALVISNPINIIVVSFFDVGFVDYAAWMALPALASMAVSYLGLRWFFRHDLPRRYAVPAARPADPAQAVERRVCATVMALTLLGFFAQGWIGVPLWLVAATGAAALLSLQAGGGHSPLWVVRRVGWGALVFVAGIFVVAQGLRNVGLTHLLGAGIATLAGETLGGLNTATALVAGACSSVINNHPTAGLMTWVIQDFALDPLGTRMQVFAALIGGDLGPKMLPIGSLAALLWFRMLADRGVEVPYRLYVRIGVPVTFTAILLAVGTLNLELWLVELLR